MGVNAAFPLLQGTKGGCEKRRYSLQTQSEAEIAAFKRLIRKVKHHQADSFQCLQTTILWNSISKMNIHV